MPEPARRLPANGAGWSLILPIHHNVMRPELLPFLLPTRRLTYEDYTRCE